MKAKINIFFVIVICISMIISCQTLTKDVDTEITPEQEYYIGRAVAANILTTYQLWNEDPELVSYLNHICAAITINSLRPNVYDGYHVAILDTNEINAFATPGGHIFLTRGIINAAKSEDALAAIIAHEVAHVQLMHGIKAIKNSRITQPLSDTDISEDGAAAEANLNQLTDIFNETINEIVQALVKNGYSQSQEFEADNMAMALMAGAGYNPTGLIELLNELRTAQTANAGFGITHPTPAQRITNAEKTVRKYRVADQSSSRQARFPETR